MSKNVEHQDSAKKHSKLYNFFNNHQFLANVLASVTASILIWFFTFTSFKVPKIILAIEDMPKQVENINERIATIQNTLDQTQIAVSEKSDKDMIENLLKETEEEFNNMYNLLSSDLNNLKESTTTEINNLKGNTTAEVDNLKKSIEEINNKLFTIAFQLSPTDKAANSIIEWSESVKDENFVSRLPLEDSDIFAIDKSTNLTYTLEELAEQKVLLSYKSENQEIFFYGQYNEKKQWDGNCIINIYQNDFLVLITDAEYNNGEISSYKQVLPYTTSAGNEVWSISERTNEGNYNSGESWNYYKQSEYKKNFEYDKASSINIINVDEFKSSIRSSLEGYYSGRTSNGSYNDDSGNACMIKFFDDGTIRTLYVGDFINGYPNDKTGNAWYIAKDLDTTYMYYKGEFEDSHPANVEKGYFENYLTHERINEILEETKFNIKNINPDIELNWASYEE